MRTLRGWFALGAALLICACTSSSVTPRQGREDRNALSATNLEGYAGRTLFEVVQRERPHWLGNLGPAATQAGVVIYHDGTRMGGPEFLRDIYVDNVASVRFLTGPEAASRFGLNHQNGAILVTSRK